MRILWTGLVWSVLAGCSSGPKLSPEPYAGPPVSIDSSGARQVVVVAAPTSGWTLVHDQAQRQFDATEVFITITRPNPAYMQTQAVIDQHLECGVASDAPIIVYARVADFGKSAASIPYHRAAAAKLRAPEPAP